MICNECRNGRHKECRWPESCPCQHLPVGTKIAVVDEVDETDETKEKSDD